MTTSRYRDWASFAFPSAGTVSDGPAAFGADLSPASVLAACRRGLFALPAPDDYFAAISEFRYADRVQSGAIAVVGDGAGNPYRVAWHSPDPRPVIDAAGGVHLGRNIRKVLRQCELSTTANAAFRRVAQACRAGREPRWLTDELLDALTELHGQGWAHSIEVWREDELVGGAMGIGVGAVMSGDSLFGRLPGAAAIAVADMAARLVAAGGTLIDAQWDSPLLRSLGAVPMERGRYLALLGRPGGPVPLPSGRLAARRLLASGSARAAGPDGA